MGTLYAKVNGTWVPISGGGIQWPIRTDDPPLVIGGSVAEQNSELYSFVELDRKGTGPGELDPADPDSGWFSLPREVQWHPISEYGPMWTSNQYPAPGEWQRDVNPSPTYSRIWGWWDGEIDIEPAEFIYYTKTPGSNITPVPPGTYVPYDQVLNYGFDVRWNFDRAEFGSGNFFFDHYEDWIRGYTGGEGDSGFTGTGNQVWDSASANLTIGTGAFFELYCDSNAYIPDTESFVDVTGTAYAGDRTRQPQLPELRVLARRWDWELGTNDPEFMVDMMVGFNSHMIRVWDGPNNRSGLPNGQLVRGTLSVLTAAAQYQHTRAAPTSMQFFRQIGISSVSFVNGVGSINPPEETSNDGLWHAQATIWGSTVGGPKIAQVLGSGGAPGSTGLLQFYLDTAFTGTLNVSWSIEYAEPTWSQTRPICGYVYVYGLVPTSGLRPNNPYFMHDQGAVLIPYDAAGGTVDVRLWCEGLTTSGVGTRVVDQYGTNVGTIVSVGPVTFGQDQLDMTLSRNAYSIGSGVRVHLVNPDGQYSNSWRFEWADIPLPVGNP